MKNEEINRKLNCRKVIRKGKVRFCRKVNRNRKDTVEQRVQKPSIVLLMADLLANLKTILINIHKR